MTTRRGRRSGPRDEEGSPLTAYAQGPGTDVLPAVRDPERLAVLERTGLLTVRTDDTFERFARLAAALLSAPVSYVSLVGHDRQVMPGAVDRDAPESPHSLPMQQSLCKFSVATGEELVIDDTLSDPLVRANEELQATHVRSYAGWPLITGSGHVLGNLCVADHQPRHWSEEQLERLRDLGALVLQEIEHRVTARDLERLRARTGRLLEEVDRARQVVGSLTGAGEQADDPHLQRWSALARSRMEAVDAGAAAVRRELDSAPARPRVGHTDLGEVVQRVVGGTSAVAGHLVVLRRDPEPMLLNCDSTELERALSNLLVTALHHSSGEAAVGVQLRAVEAERPTAHLEVRASSARVPTGELGRLVGRLDRAHCAAAGQERRPASITVTGRGTSVISATVRATSSAEGLRVTARWPLGER